jgi:hypothetical protein
MKKLILSLVCICAFVSLAPLGGFAAETAVPSDETSTPFMSAGFGLGYNGLIPFEMGPALALFNLRLGGYGRISFAEMGKSYLGEGSIGFEFGFWTLMLPADNPLVMLEIPLSISLQYLQQNGDSYSFSMGYCPFIGYGEDFELNQAITLNCRYEMGMLFFHAGVLLPLGSLEDFHTTHHLAVGFCF